MEKRGDVNPAYTPKLAPPEGLEKAAEPAEAEEARRLAELAEQGVAARATAKATEAIRRRP